MSARLFAIELRTVAIVLAESEAEALAIADMGQRDILRDTTDMELDALGEVNTIKDASNYGWDARCIPYGGDGNTPLGQLIEEIAAQPPEPERCTRTLELPL